MLGKTILLYSNDKNGGRRLSGHLRAAGNEVIAVDDATTARDLVGARAVDLVFVDGAAPDPHAVVTAARGTIPAVVLSTAGDPAVMLDFVCTHEVEHFLARSGDGGDSLDELAREVVVTAEKILRADLFGLEKYLPSFGLELTTSEIRGASDRDDVVTAIGAHVDWLGAGTEARRAVEAVADELVTNAVYDAPRDVDGRPRYLAVDRRQKVVLDPWELVTVRWGSDGDQLAISVTDWFGALRPEHVRAGLRRCLAEADPIEQKAGGAGLGLYTALAYSSQLVVNIDRGTRTEIIALIDLRRRAHGARRGGRSLHLFCEDTRAHATLAPDATPVTIEVSDTMRVELRATLAPRKRRADVIPLTRGRRSTVNRFDSRPTARARGSTPPPTSLLDEPIGAGTACGLLRGARDRDTALRIALRFLTQHYQAAIAYEVAGDQLEPTFATGDVRDWPLVRSLRLLTSGPSSVVARARLGEATPFLPGSPLDYRLAMLVTGISEAAGLVVPIHSDGALQWILYAAAPLADQPVGADTLAQVRREVEACLVRVDPAAAVIEVGVG